MKKHENIYPVGSQTPTLYGNPKLHETFTDVPSLRPDVSFINSFNYKLDIYLSTLLQPQIPSPFGA